MEEINGVTNIYLDQKFKLYYKRDQKYPNYAYYNCFVKECPGRIKFDHTTKVQVSMCEHSDHHSFEKSTNSIDLLRFRNKCIEMAIDENYIGVPPPDIYRLILAQFPGIQLVKGHKSQMKRAIENSRYRYEHRRSKYSVNNLYAIT